MLKQQTCKCHCHAPLSLQHTNAHSYGWERLSILGANWACAVRTESFDLIPLPPVLRGHPLMFLLLLHKPSIQFIMPLRSPKGDGQIYRCFLFIWGRMGSSDRECPPFPISYCCPSTATGWKESLVYFNQPTKGLIFRLLAIVTRLSITMQLYQWD